MANPERGTKRTDPETGKKFYDLNQDPIVSPYTGKSYPRSFFEQAPAASAGKPAPERARRPKAEPEAAEEETEEVERGPEVISLEEAEAGTGKDSQDDGENEKPGGDAEEEDLAESNDDDVFLEDDEDSREDFDIDVDNDDDDDR